MTSVKGWHTGRLWSMTLSASLRTVILCFSLLLLYIIIYKKLFLDLGKNIVKWRGQCFLPELAKLTRSFLLNPKHNDTVPLCLKIREAMDGNGAGDIWGTTVRNKRVPISGFMGIFATEDWDEELKTFWESMLLREYRIWGIVTRRL